ncbi:MAG: transposase [Bacteroidales bacterium]|nr:MAG: transposase [Bacteroidales bacterium]
MVRNSFQYSHSGLSKLFFLSKGYVLPFPGTGPHRLAQSWSIGCPCAFLRRTGARSDSEGSLQCLIIDDTDLPKTGFKTEADRPHLFPCATQEHPRLQGAVPVPYRQGRHRPCLTFSLHGEEGKNPEKIQGLTSKQRNARFCKVRDEKSVVNTRIREYKQSKIERSIEMVRHAMKKGIRFDYLLVDSWFTCADLIRFITSRHLECHLIGMLKMGKTRYRTEAGNLNAPVIIDRLKKEKVGQVQPQTELLLCPHGCRIRQPEKSGSSSAKRGRKGAWNAFLSTDTRLDFFEAYRIYSMRWAIEVCFSEMKGLLRLGKCQCRNFSSQIASISLTLMQYNILSHIKRFEAYETIGGLFDRTVNGAMELSVTERIWELILQIVAVIAELFSADEEEIIRMIAYDNPKINIIKDLCGVKKTA